MSEFVEALKTELESTFKEEITVYFDINPHDGLLETHDVNASLKEKLKCLIFIPIISRTYCDPKSFAWEHEFNAFIEQTSQDQFGLKVKLPNGNVASRVLPIRIHDLDSEDIKLCESLLGGMIRGIEFIYKEPGVNKPLVSEDDEKRNLNNTKYRIQINKTANAIKEIIVGLKGDQATDDKENAGVLKYNERRGAGKRRESEERHEQRDPDGTPVALGKQKKKILFYKAGIYFAIATAVFAVLYFNDIINKKPGNNKEEPAKTLAVLPFENRIENEENSWFGDALTNALIMQINNLDGFKVRPASSVLQYKGTTKSPLVIGQELKVNYIIGGSVVGLKDSIRINVYLSNAETNIQQWSKSFEGTWKDILNVQSKIALDLAYKLKAVLSTEEIARIDLKMTEEPEAFKYYSQGSDMLMRSLEPHDYTEAMIFFEKAIKLDPEFCMAHMKLGICYLQLYWLDGRNTEMLKKCKMSIDDAFRIDPDIQTMSEAHFSLAQYYYYGFLDYEKALEEVETAEKISNYRLEYPAIKAAIYRRTGKWELAAGNYIKAFEAMPNNSAMAFYAAQTLYLIGKYQESEMYFKTASLIAPATSSPYWERINMHMKSEGNTIRARETLAEAFQYNEIINDDKLVESSVLMDIYDGQYDKALSTLSSSKIVAISTQFSFNLKYLLCARLYSLKNMPETAHSYYDSARVDIESRILKTPTDSRLYSALGIAYAGLEQKGNAVSSGAKAVELTPVNKDAFFGVYREMDLARIFVMVGEYSRALEKIKMLLSRPGPLSVKLLMLDPDWRPLWESAEFKKIIKNAPSDDSRI